MLAFWSDNIALASWTVLCAFCYISGGYRFDSSYCFYATMACLLKLNLTLEHTNSGHCHCAS